MNDNGLQMALKLPRKIGDAGRCVVRRQQKKKNGDRNGDDATQMLALRVRRRHVRKLLHFLLTYNPIYRAKYHNIDHGALRELPEGGIPEGVPTMLELRRDASLKKIGDLFVTRSVFEAWLEASRDDGEAFPIGSASLQIWEPQYHNLSVDVSPLLEDIQLVPRGNMKSDMVHMSNLMWYIHRCNITLNLHFLREFARELPHIHSTLGHPEEYADNKEARKAENKKRATRLEK